MQEIVDPLSFIDDMQYDENSSSNEISSNIEKLSDEEKITILIDYLTLLSKKYGLGEVKFWYEPFSDGYKIFSIKISPDKCADELIDLLYKIEDEMEGFAKKNNMERFFAYSCVQYDYDVE
ncbi:MAG: hypothetical protein Q4Q19_08100 [Methanobrevibacter sp.]|nr:hypothetical protein [Methanobrevibacter sp.]